MSTAAVETQAAAIAAALQEAGAALIPTGPLRWRLALPAWPRHVDARLDDGWLLMDGPLPPAAEPRSPWELLLANDCFAGPAKFALAADGEPRVRAELPVDGLAHVAARVLAVCADLARAADFCARPPEERPTAAAESPEQPADAASVREVLGPVIEAAGWPFTERSGNRLMVALDVPDAVYQACVALHPGDTVRASVEFARFDSLSRLGRRALGTLLLCACGLVRLARAAAVVRDDGQATVGFELRLALPVAPAELHHALSSLVVAARLCGREVSGLRGEPLERTYLRVHESGSRVIQLTDATPHVNQEDGHGSEWNRHRASGE